MPKAWCRPAACSAADAPRCFTRVRSNAHGGRVAPSALALLAIMLLAAAAGDLRAHADAPLRIGSKRFTESYILAEVVRETVAKAGGTAVHKPGLGNTGIVFAALRADAIDVYPEYTGTVAREILGLPHDVPLADLNERLAPLGLAAGVALGFENTYALAMREEAAARLNVHRISDLARHVEIRMGLSQEFIARSDGWSGLKAAYALPQATPSGLDHGLAYEAIAAGRIDVIDVYTTDAKIESYGLRVLEDDRRYFPKYDAVLLYRADLPQRVPEAWRAIASLAGRIGARTMIRMNAAAEIDGLTFADAARLLTAPESAAGAPRRFADILFGPDFWRLTREHVVLVAVSLALSALGGIPLGLLAARCARLGKWVLGAVGVVQTMPSLALLAFLIAALGTIGTLPALIALVLYALLPIVRNTHAGILGVGDGMRDAARALGLASRDRLLAIELPLAAPTILAGIKTSAVINVGTATLAAFVGAGGYGERIVQGLALNDSRLLLAGALPAAALALLVQGAFDVFERRLSSVRARVASAGR
jgi:osmoprotectant transport system permease protein